MSKLENEFNYFLKNKEALFREYPNKFLVIKDEQVIGAYDDQVSAFTQTTQSHKPGTFLIQNTSPESMEPQIFHSRVLAL